MPPGSEWQRLHPLTPLLRGGRYAAATAALALQDVGDLGQGLILAVFAAGGVVGSLLGYVSWRRTAYRVEAASLEFRHGVLVRRRRRVPLARLETVDVRRPFVARALGLATITVETVGDADSEVTLAYLTEPGAEALRAQLLAERAGLAPDTPAPQEQLLVRTPLSALVTVTLIVPAVVACGWAAVSGLLAVADPAVGAGVALTGIPALLAITGGQLVRLEAWYDASVAEAPDGLRLRRGLLNLRSQTVPLARVQAVRVVEPWLWRRWDWVRVVVDVAGYRGGRRPADRADSEVLLPVAPRWLAAQVVARIYPDLVLGATALAPAPPLARWRLPVTWRGLGAAWTPTYAITARGRFRRTTDVMPHRKVQSWRVVQGPWQRRLDLATLHLDSPGSSVAPQALHRSHADAIALLRASQQLAGNPPAPTDVSGA